MINQWHLTEAESEIVDKKAVEVAARIPHEWVNSIGEVQKPELFNVLQQEVNDVYIQLVTVRPLPPEIGLGQSEQPCIFN